jgi:hypothetical protein
MSDNVVKFADAASRRVHLSKPEAERPRSRQSESVISKNFQLRQQRQKVWREAETATRYWLALMDFDDACKSAQRWEIRESFAYSPGERGHNVAVWRGALMRQLLTPAPDGRAIEWKRRTFASGQHEHTDTKPERIERAIADDVTFLAAHPVRQSKQQDGAEQPETAEQAALRRMARNATLAAPEPPPSEEELKPPGAA